MPLSQNQRVGTITAIALKLRDAGLSVNDFDLDHNSSYVSVTVEGDKYVANYDPSRDEVWRVGFWDGSSTQFGDSGALMLRKLLEGADSNALLPLLLDE